MAAVTAKDCHALSSYYESIYNDKYGVVPNINRYSARWGFDAVLNSMNVKQAKELLDYYLTTPGNKKHDLDWFFYHYHELLENMRRTQNDTAHRKLLMEQSKKRAEEWRKSGRQSIGNN